MLVWFAKFDPASGVYLPYSRFDSYHNDYLDVVLIVNVTVTQLAI